MQNFCDTLGVDADVEVREVAERTLFAVTPRNQNEALANIYEALRAYLQLPAAELVGVPQSQDERIATQSLAANVYHLRGQLQLADAKLALEEERSETLRERVRIQQLAIDLLQRRLLPTSPAIATDHMLTSTAPTAADEESLGKYVSVTDIEREGLRVHLPQLLRDLKKLFGRE